MKRVFPLLLLLWLIAPDAVQASIFACNKYSSNYGAICTGSGDCPDFSAADAGAGACVEIEGVEKQICSSGSTNQGFPCSSDTQCPDENSGDGISSICGVACQAVPGTSTCVPLFRHPRGAGSDSAPALIAEAIIAIAQRIPELRDNCIAEFTLATEGQQCISKDDNSYCFCVNPSLLGNVNNCDNASEWQCVEAAEPPTLQALIDACGAAGSGKCVITGPSAGTQYLADSSAEGLHVCQAQDTNCLNLYAASGGAPVIAGVTGSGFSIDAASGQPIDFKFNGTTAVSFDDDGSIDTFSSWRQRQPMTWLAGSLTPDGTICTRATEATIRGPAIVCSGSGGTITGWIPTRGAFDPSVALTAHFGVETVTTAGQVWSADLACYCAGDGEARPTTALLDGDTTNQITINVATNGLYESVNVTGISCGGSCAASDGIWYRLTSDASMTATNDFFLESTLVFTQNKAGE